MLCVCNCDIRAERKILALSETKQYKICSKRKVWVNKNFFNLLPNFAKGLNKTLAYILSILHEQKLQNEVKGSFKPKAPFLPTFGLHYKHVTIVND